MKKADEPGEVLGVGEFLRHVRRMVVDFVVGRVLSEAGAQGAAAELDDVTTYYLLHRHDFGLDPAPVGACILYAVSCGLSDRDLADRLDLLAAKKSRRGGGDDADDEEEAAGSSGSEVRLKRWKQRRRKTMGFERPGGGPVPLVDQVHRLMHLWRGGDRVAVDDYVHARGLDRHVLFVEVLQALVELAPEGSEERSLLERIAKHLAAEGAPLPRQLVLRNDEEGDRP